ncbi:4-hydroxy-tetrahydrodipicolinate reductase [Listeria sp. FSL L7-1485]|uniref:4-hydroxy-tetrahydrodipicolinate reductase n=1 Tax=Listeria immobilis TaxID=2713502 RepID=A0A7X0X6M3_9LIST|nr:4-hydroxy-tetrahydrodipicolinate reductase [Listeria immobilis]MBC1488452.1 4-hydroxy-tetrahydrodipicolinate reductase [Listeria immobilis]MBC1515822.1 4-hydroxy-tetrahydrodipicolinate reductase [Listeria immobilis]MBC1534965.1 4-hydroxy-tetrahydrodipicolinate reductase [Listeria immobilis]
MKVAVSGFKGRMGHEVVKTILKEEGLELIAVLDHKPKEKNICEIAEFSTVDVPVYSDLATMLEESKPDCVVDFTTPKVGYNNTKTIIEHGVRAVVGTTGFQAEQIAELRKMAETKKIGAVIAPNFAVGAVLMMQFAQKAAKYFPNVEIIELHHDNKLDAPSGTAVKTAEMMAEVRDYVKQGAEEEVELIEGARGGEFEGMRIHSVRLPGLVAHQEVIFGAEGQGLTLRHDSYDRVSFMSGVALAVRKTKELETLIYGLENILD